MAGATARARAATRLARDAATELGEPSARARTSPRDSAPRSASFELPPPDPQPVQSLRDQRPVPAGLSHLSEAVAWNGNYVN